MTKAQAAVAKMTLDEKIGQVMLMDLRRWAETETSSAKQNRDMVTENGAAADTDPVCEKLTVLNDEVRDLIYEYHLGGVILFADNCTDNRLLVKLIYDMQHASIDRGGLPLLLGIDQEGGNVTRIAQACCMSGSMAIASAGKTENAYLNGRLIGSELKALGINCDFAPVADVNSNPNNPVIGMRSFSDKPEVVADMAKAMADGLAENGIIPCAKHFPGHGDTDTDSHTGLPLVNGSSGMWPKGDGYPFIKLTAAGIPMIMTAHIQYPALDDTKAVSKADGRSICLPATLSKRILTDLLRQKMSFKGVVVSDAMNMGAIADNFGPEESIIMALNAGVDMICMPVECICIAHKERLDRLYAAIRNAVKEGTLPEARLDEAVARIIKMKADFGILEDRYGYDVEKAQQYAAEFVGGKENRALERRLARESVQILTKEPFEPFKPEQSEKVVFAMPYDSEVNSVRFALRLLRNEGRLGSFDESVISYEKQAALSEEQRQLVLNADRLVIGVEETVASKKNPNHWHNTVAAELLSLAKRGSTAVIYTGLPYGAKAISEKHPCFVLCNYTGMQETDVVSDRIMNKCGLAIPAGVELILCG